MADQVSSKVAELSWAIGKFLLKASGFGVLVDAGEPAEKAYKLVRSLIENSGSDVNNDVAEQINKVLTSKIRSMYGRPTVNKELLEVAVSEVKFLLDKITDDRKLLVLAVKDPDNFSDLLRNLACERKLDIEQEAEPYFNELVDVVEKQYVKVAPRSSEFDKAALKDLFASNEQILTKINQIYELSEDTNKEVKNSNAKLDDVKKDVNDVHKVVAEIRSLLPIPAKEPVIFEEVAEALSKRSKRLTLDPAIKLVDAHAVVGVFEEPRRDDAPSNVNRDAYTSDAVERLVSWACGSDDEHSPMCALLGDLGTGKTTTTVLATQRLLELRKIGEQVPLPIYFDLRDLSPTTLKDFGLRTLLTQLLANASRDDVTVDDVLATVQDEHTLIVFDGLDEVLVHLSPSDGQHLTRSLLEVLNLGKQNSQEENPRTCLLLSCRTQYFRTVEEEFFFFDGQGRENKRGRDYLVLTLLPFDEDQIREYLRRNVPEADINQLMETICSVHNLRELASQPVLLDMIREVLPTIDEDLSVGHQVRSVDLYEGFVNEWLRRDEGKNTLIPEHKIQLMTHLAWRVWRSGSRTWSARWMEDWMLKFLHAHPDMELHYAGRMPDQWKQDFRTATFLTRRGDDFSFEHSSFLEYFLAVRLADSLEAESEDEARAAWGITRPSNEAFAFFAELIDRLPSHAQRQRLARLTHVGRHASAPARTNVFAYTLRALDKGAPHPRPDALNLADTDLRGWTIGSEKTPLNLAGISLRGARLDDARIRRARLDGIDATAASMRRTLLEHCTLSDASLEEADLAGTIFRHCDLDGASLDKATRYRTQLLHTVGYQRELSDTLTAPLTEDTPLRALPKAQILGGHSGYVTAVAWSPDGHHILTASNDGTARIWDAITGDNTLTLTRTSWVSAVAWSPDGTHILTASKDRAARVWDAITGDKTLTFTLTRTSWVSAVAWSPDGHHILTGSMDGTARVWDATTGDNTLTFTLTRTRWVSAVAWSPDGTHILTASMGRAARIWDAITGDNTLTLTHTDPVTAVVWSPDGHHILTVLGDHTVRVWTIDGKNSLTLARTGRVDAVAWSHDGELILTVSHDQHMRAWDSTTGKCLSVLMLQGTAPFSAIAWSPDERRILTGSIDGTARIWDVTTGVNTLTLTTNSVIEAVAWSPDSTQILTGCQDGTARIWDATTGEQVRFFIAVLPEGECAVLTPDQTRVIGASPYAWRWLGRYAKHPGGALERIPVEIDGPLPPLGPGATIE